MLLLVSVEPGERLEELGIHRLDGPQDPLAAVAGRVAVAPFDRLVGARGGPRRHRRAAKGAAVQGDIHLDGGVSAAVENLAADNIDDVAHRWVRLFGFVFR